MARNEDSAPWVALPKQTFREYFGDEAPLRAAALAFFSLFALGAMFILVVAASAVLLGEGQMARDQILRALQRFLGPGAADAVQSFLSRVRLPGGGFWPTLIGVAVLLWAASRVFAHLEKVLNIIWDVRPKEGRDLARTLRKRAVSFGIVVAVGLLAMVGLLVTSILSAPLAALDAPLPGERLVWRLVNFAASVLVLSVLFAVLFKYLPDARIEWDDVLVGAVATGVLFAAGQLVIGHYIGQSAFTNAFGAAGSAVVVLLWLYYSALVFLLGAEFTQVYARRRGKPIRPERDIAERRGAKDGTTGG